MAVAGGVPVVEVGAGAWLPSISFAKTMMPADKSPQIAETSIPTAGLSVGIPTAAHAPTVVSKGTRKAMSIISACCPFDSPDIFYSPISVIPAMQ
jgi:hypothetical protein